MTLTAKPPPSSTGTSFGTGAKRAPPPSSRCCGEESSSLVFDQLRRYARHHNLRLSEVARQVLEADLAAEMLGAPPAAE